MNKAYILDALYGTYNLPDFVWDIIPTAELQRLREVRLCNINSFCLTGGANINRYEHALGTCHLALECLDSWPLFNPVNNKERIQFVLAALLHDIASAAFGHSIEYIESQAGFEHEQAFSHVVLGQVGGSYQYRAVTLEPIFFGMPRGIASKLSAEDLKSIGDIILGKGRFGPLINSNLDLDNIDNVFRLAYHIGITKSVDTPLQLSKSLWVNDGNLVLKKESIPLVEQWHAVRKRLYEFLLLNPQEFAAKCMLTELIETTKSLKNHPFNWYEVDFQLCQNLMGISSETDIIISRLMKGDLYGCIAIYSSKIINNQSTLFDRTSRDRIANEISLIIRSKFPARYKSAMIALHLITDINKTERQVEIKTDDNNLVKIGNRSEQLLIGVFFKNLGLNMYEINNIPDDTLAGIRSEIYNYLSTALNDSEIREVTLYGESRES